MDKRRFLIVVVLGLFLTLIGSKVCLGQPALPQIEIGWTNADDPEQVAASLRILALITILSLAPAILIMFTAFTRIVVSVVHPECDWSTAISTESGDDWACSFLDFLYHGPHLVGGAAKCVDPLFRWRDYHRRSFK